MQSEVEQIAKSLTKAQRIYLTERAKWAKPAHWAQERWMTFPPASTHRVLCNLGLTDRSGQIRELGLQVRAFLQAADSSTQGQETKR